MNLRNTVLIAACCAAIASCSSGSYAPNPVIPYLGALGTARRTTVPYAQYKVLYSFGSRRDGSAPSGKLLNVGGLLYGTTENGGDGYYGGGVGSGVVYTLTIDGVERVIHRFKLGNVNGPTAGLTRIGNTFYGTTEDGGTHHCGTVFAMTSSGNVRYLYNFRCAPDGANPSSRLIEVGGEFYGTTASGGPQNYGTIFRISPSGHYRQLHVFLYGKGGQGVTGDLIYVDGEFYGVTYSGGGTNCQNVGTIGCGTIFGMSRTGYTRTLYRFQGGSEGDSPTAGLTEWDGLLYGTTYYGGNELACVDGCGTVYSFNPAAKSAQVVYQFVGGGDGMLPDSTLLVFHGLLYGVTALGGNGGCFPYSSCGTIFRVSASGQEAVVHAFKRDGYLPSSGLTPINGVLYGSTLKGGSKCRLSFGCGLVYAVRP